MKYLEKELNELLEYIDASDEINLSVSKKSVVWHIDHALKVINGICETTIASNPLEYKWKFSLVRLVIMTVNKIPRGKGRAPKTVRPKDEINLNEVLLALEKAKKLSQEILTLNKKSYFEHPYFGLMPLKQTKKFIILHTEHHLKIIRDIKKVVI